DYPPDYETARQVGSLLLTVLTDLGVKGKAMDALRDQLDAEPYFNRQKRIELVLESVRQIMKLDDNAKYKKDRDQFVAFVKNINTTSPEELLDNDLLDKMYRRVGNPDFTAAITKTGTREKPGTADLLQRFSDEEQDKLLKVVADYTPQHFYAAVADVEK